jgi:lysophospholipase L1-like esterase
VLNEGVGGNLSSQLIERLDTDVLVFKPKLVIILIGTNDVGRKLSVTVYKVSDKEYKANVSYLVNKIQAIGSKVVLLSPPPRGTEAITTPSYFLNDRNDKFNRILDTVSRETHCYYLDINTAFKKAGSPNATASSYIRNAANTPDMPDGIHLTPDGTTFLTNQVFNFLKKDNLTDLNLVICFGDSLTETSGYPELLQKLLTAR